MTVPDELLKLKTLLDSGLLTEEEFQTQKVKLLAKNQPRAAAPGLDGQSDKMASILAAAQTHIPPPAFTQRPHGDDHKSMVNAGWACAFLFPIAGVIIGIILLTKNRVGTGVAQIALSLFMWDFWIGFWPAFMAAL